MLLSLSRMHLQPIGIIHSRFTEAAGTPIQPPFAADAQGEAEVLPEFAPGLEDLDGFERIWLIYWCDRTAKAELLVTPYLDTRPHGVFATRAPSRPNPVGISCVRRLAVRENWLRVAGVDVLDGTPLLDVKPYVAAFDAFRVTRCGWLAQADFQRGTADGRFESRQEQMNS